MTEESSAARTGTLPAGRSPRGTAVSDAPDPNPFPGPRSYRRNQAALFFGRGNEIEKLTSLVLSTSAVLLYAQSGSGKSSLLQAGLLPSLEGFGYRILDTVRFDQVGPRPPGTGADIPEPNPFAKLVCDTVLSKDDVPPETPALGLLAGYLAKRDGKTPTLLVLDQLEGLFADQALWRERADFLGQLRRVLEASQWLHCVLAIRSDYLANLLPHEPELPGRMLIRCGLESLREQAAQEAIEKAFSKTDVPLAPAEMDSVLCRLLSLDVGQNVPPVKGQYVNLIQLQILCRRLWQEKARPTPPSVAGADEGSQVLQESQADLADYMRSFVDDAVASVITQTQSDEGVVRRWLEDRLITPAGRRDFHLVDEGTAGLPKSVLGALEDARLIQLEQRNQSLYAELTHDSMVAAVQASNKRWVGTRLRTRRWLTLGLTLALLALLATFPLFRTPTDETLLAEATGTVARTTSNIPIPPAPRGDVAVVHIVLLGESRGGARVRVSETEGFRQRTVASRVVMPSRDGVLNTIVNFAIKTTPKAAYTVRLNASGTLGYAVTVRSAPVILSPLVPGRTAIVNSPLFAVKLDSNQLLDLRIFGAELTGVWDARTLITQASASQAVVESPGRQGYAVFWVNSPGTAVPAAEVTGRLVKRGPALGPGTHAQIRAATAAISQVRIATAAAPFAVDTSCPQPVSVKVIDSSGRSVGTNTQFAPTDSVLVPAAYGSQYSLVLLGTTGAALNCRVSIRSFAQQGITTTSNRTVHIYPDTLFNAYPIRLPAGAAVIVTGLKGASASLNCLSGQVATSDSERLLAFVPKNHDCVLSITRPSANFAKSASFPLQIAPISGG